jgi:hypothetical protein
MSLRFVDFSNTVVDLAASSLSARFKGLAACVHDSYEEK